jgi:selT/selW/selH-like putative selenoprotein
LAAELKRIFPQSTVNLIKSSGGAFEIRQDGKMIFSKLQEGRFPDSAEIVKKLQAVQG